MTLAKIQEVRDFNYHMISMGGTSYLPIEYYTNKHPTIKKMILCLDNDEEGHFFSWQIRERYGKDFQISKHVPVHKDFNEDLINTHEHLKDAENKKFDRCNEEELAI
jgi:hypothetical protein